MSEIVDHERGKLPQLPVPVKKKAPAPLANAVRILGALALAELRATRDFTIVGVLKWILEPLSYMLIYFVLVASILDRPRFAYPLFLLCALVPWRYFTGVVLQSMTLLARYASVITNRALPKTVLPLVLMVAEGASFVFALALFAPLVVYYEIGVWPAVLWIPVTVLSLALVTSGPAYLAAVFGLYFPDYRGTAGNLLRAAFFVSTALIPLSEVPGDDLPQLLKANPMSGVFDSFRAVLLRGDAPQAVDILYPMAAGVFLLGIALVVYRWRQHEFPKEVW